MTARPGNWVAIRHAIPSEQEADATNAATTTNASLNTALGANAAIAEPIATPIDRRHGPAAQHLVEHGALGAVRQIGADRGRHDDRERGADAQLHAHLVRHAENAEHLVEHRHDDGAAADAEQAGQKAGHDAADDDRGRQPEKLADRDSEQGKLRGWSWPQ